MLRLLKLIRVSLSLAGLAFFAYAISLVEWSAMAPSILWLGLVVPVFWISLGFSVAGFIALARAENNNTKTASLFWVYVDSWIARYAPGPSAIASKTASLASLSWDVGAALKLIAVDFMHNLILTSLVALILGTSLLQGCCGADIPSVYVTILISGLVLTSGIFAYSIIRGVGRGAIYLFLGSRVFLAVAVALSFRATTSMPMSEVLPLTALYLGAVVIGYLALVVPGGIGVRESAFILGASWFGYSIETAAALAASARLATLLADLGVLGLWVLRRATIRKRDLL